MDTMTSWLPTAQGNLEEQKSAQSTDVTSLSTTGYFQESLLFVYNSPIFDLLDNSVLPTNCMDHSLPWEAQNSSVSRNPPDMEPEDVFKTIHHRSLSLNQIKSMSISNFSHGCYMSHSAHPFLFDQPNVIWWRVQMRQTLTRILTDRK
jgi:hypothetical protein